MLSSSGFFTSLDLPIPQVLGMDFGLVLGAILEKSQSSEESSGWSTAILMAANESGFITFPALLLKFVVNITRPAGIRTTQS